MAYGDLITGNGQVEYNGMVFGDNVVTYLGEDGITGWEDQPPADSGNIANATTHGSTPGELLLQERVITWSGDWRPPRGDDGSALRALRAATGIVKGTTELPLVIRLLGETLLAFGRITNKALPSTRAYSVGAGILLLQWTCSDVRRYSLDEHDEQILLPTPTPVGLVYSLVYPLDYGTPVAPPTGSVTNSLDQDTPCRLVFSGAAMSGPGLRNGSTGQMLGFDIDLVATDVLEVDTRVGTVLLNGVDRLYTRTTGSTPVQSFLLAAGENDLQLSADSWDTGAQVEIFWRDATI